jgi:hypothetical protein
MRGMRRAKPEQMARWLSRGKREGWSLTELSRHSGHPRWKLRWWQKRLERTRREVGRSGRAFVAVEVTDPKPDAGAAIEVTTPSGYRLQVPHDFDAAYLRRLVEALERRC